MAISASSAAAVESVAAAHRPRLGVRAAAAAAAPAALLLEFRGLSLRASRRRPRVLEAAAKGGSKVGVARRGIVVCETLETALDVPDVSKSTWDQLVLSGEKLVLVEFWAPWCGPCRMMHPVIGNLSKRYEGKLKCFKLNTDKNQDIATRYGIRSIPTIMIFKNGKKKDTIIGAVPETTLVTTVEKFL